MVEIFHDLFQKLLIPNDQIVHEANEQLMLLYQNPESIFHLINLINSSSQESMRKFAIIGIKYTLMHSWQIIKASEHLQTIKDNMLNLLISEQDRFMRQMVLDAMSTIFTTECDNWPKLIELIQTLSVSNIENECELFLSLFSAIISYLPIETVASLFERLCGISRAAISSQSISLILAGSNLLRVMLTLISTEPQIISSLFQDMLNAFYALLRNNSSIIGQVMDDMCEIIKKTDQFFDSAQSLLPPIFSIYADDQIPFENRCIMSELLCALIDQYPRDFEEVSSQIISMSLELASHVIVNDCLDEQRDLMFVIRPIEHLSKNINPFTFFADFWGSVAVETPEKLISSALAVSSYIEYIPEVISIHFSDVFEFALDCMKNQNHCIQEAGFSILFQLISKYYNLLSELFEKLMTIILPILQESTHEPLLCSVLTSLIELLYLIDIDDKFLTPLMKSVILLIPKLSGPNKYLAINGLAAIIFSANESISIFVPDLIQILQQAASHSPSEHPLILSAGIEALSYLVKYAPNETEIVHQFLFEKIHQCLQLEDPSLLSSCMISLKQLAKSPIFIINSEILFKSIIEVLKYDIDSLGSESALFSAITEAKQTTLSFLSTLSRKKPEIVIPFISDIAHLVINQFEIDEHSIQESSLKASIVIAQLLSNSQPEILNPFLGKLINNLLNNFEASKTDTVCISFYGFSQLVSLNLKLESNIFNSVIETAFFALKNSLNCQQDDDFLNPELSDEVFGFLATIAQYLPEAFPFEHFFNHTQKLIQLFQQNKIEEKISILIECIGVLVEYFAVSYSSIQSLFKVTLRQWFFETLKTCTMEYPPHPLSAVRCYIEVTNQIKPEELQAVIEITSRTLNTKFNGQTYYWNTIAASISLLLSILRISGLTIFDSSQIMSQILSFLPRCLCESESDNIISSLIYLCKQTPSFLQSYYNYIVRILSQILSMKNKKLKKLKISQEILSNSVQLIHEMRNTVPNCDQLIQGHLDQFSIIRFQQRIH